MSGLEASAIWVSAGMAFWLGVLTSISPCPLASNVAAISYIGRGLAEPRRVLAAGLLYTLGRVVTYSLLGWLILRSLASIVGLSNSLQVVMNQLLGPALIIAGMFMLELIGFKGGSIGVLAGLEQRAGRWGMWGAALLGGIFALSFCPVSAALFFGSLIPLAMSSGSSVLMPSIYGVGTGLPVVAFAVVTGFGARALSSAFQRVSTLEPHARKLTGVVFILVGVYYTLNYVFEVFD